ncbi:hypothetical protein [Enterococcus gilvus]|uniref:hypothetical protein n=1 Tax=Enterococcus gilvus TaxID=160453 RepID=UPI003ED84EDB
MKLAIKSNLFFFVGIILVVLNATSLDFKFALNILGIALVLFSEPLTKLVNRHLKDNQ